MDQFARAKIETLELRVGELERRMKTLSGDSDLESPPSPSVPQAAEFPDEVRELAAAGKTVQAVAAYQKLTGEDIVSSKAAVERLQAELGS
jgi:hypothetical protein